MYHHLPSSATHACACTLALCTTTSHCLLPMPVHAPALHTTTLPLSAAHACVCTLTPCTTTSHHLPPALHTTPPVICPHAR
ncbi:hypothetical protein ID866_12949, partial [Astraeus odoratus]